MDAQAQVQAEVQVVRDINQILGEFNAGYGGTFNLALVDDNAGVKYLKAETGYALKSQQEKAISKAIQQPEAFISDREILINNIYTTKVQPAFKRAYDELSRLGLPEDILKTMVMKRADNALQEELEVLNLQFPGYEDALGRQRASRELMEQRNFNGSVQGLSKADKQAIKEKAIRKYKASKKAKKASKA